MYEQCDDEFLKTTSFWDEGQFKRVPRKMLQGIENLDLISLMVKERAEVELSYAQSLAKWRERWMENFEKSGESGSLKTALVGCLDQARTASEIHLEVSNLLMDLSKDDLPRYKRNCYTKEFIGYREPKLANKAFSKAQKPWEKLLEKTHKKQLKYHKFCCLQYEIAQHLSGPFVSDSLDRKKEAENLEKVVMKKSTACDKYNSALKNLRNYVERYQTDMIGEYMKCQDYELSRLHVIKKTLLKYISVLNITLRANYHTQYEVLTSKVSGLDAVQDLTNYDRQFGIGMLLKVPLFFDWTVDMATSSSITFPYEERLVYNASRSVYENKKALDNVYSCEKNIERQPSYNNIKNAASIYKATASYKAVRPYELSLIENERVFVVEQKNDGWCLAENNFGDRGLVPSSILTRSQSLT
ncbi:protein kinase C and casein kinase substrate in neurons protein 2-like [Zophobas morio]|uniref:protein kinase C and casein kinase substrate in neurons protein 2-like n=1 Tax=Zophobas morio TaxID=2755281 RepID=UPI003082C151